MTLLFPALRRLAACSAAALLLAATAVAQDKTVRVEKGKLGELLEFLQPDASVAGIPLLAAIWASDVEAVRELVAAGADTEVADLSGRTALNLSVVLGNKELAEVLLAAGADPNSQDTLFQNSPLHSAAHLSFYDHEQGSNELSRLLLDHGADVSLAEEKGNTALHLAADYGNLAGVRMLIDHGADPAGTNLAGDSPLAVALGAPGNPELVELLIEASDGFLGKPNENNIPPLFRIVQKEIDSGYWALIAPLVTPAMLEAPDLFGSTAVHAAAFTGHAANIQALAELGANLHTANIDGMSPAHWAATGNHPAAIGVLGELGASLELADSTGATPLFYAAQFGNEEAVRELLEQGADIAQPAQQGRLAIHGAAQEGHASIIARLARGRSPLDAGDDNGDTALHLAALNGHDAAIEALLDAGADINAANAAGQTALFYAMRSPRGLGASILIDRDADIRKADGSGATPLGAAWQYGHLGGFLLLLLNGAILPG